jgi:hypothetical protein
MRSSRVSKPEEKEGEEEEEWGGRGVQDERGDERKGG